MKKHTCIFHLVLPLVLTWGVVTEAMAIEADVEPDYIEGGVRYFWLSDDYDDWRGLYVKGAWQQNERLIWDGEVVRETRFDDTGTYVVAGLTYNLNQDWYTSLHLGTGTDSIVFPRYRADAFINRKLLAARNLVATVGVTWLEEHDDVHSERALYVGASYYFEVPWIVEAGVRWNESRPGPETSQRGKLAVTHGRDQHRYITLAVDHGREAYQYVDPDITVLDFRSTVASLTWREWWKNGWGHNVVLEYYESEFYKRNGVHLGVFRKF